MASPSPAAVLLELATRAVVALAAAAVVLTATACSGSGSDDAQQSQDPASEATTVADAAGPAAPGVYDQRVIFGQSAAFSGPAQELG
ncbi:MAG: hypothetical protein OXI03_10300, partial [Chloroflexota bacterium]|nr:hypothetical protein [Chloroflexota bacterium]